MGRLFPLLVLADIALMVVALIDCLSVEDSEIRALPRTMWVLIILLFSPVGPIAWFVAGRPERATPPMAPPAGYGAHPAGRKRQLAPDDNPEFLRSLSERNRQDQHRKDEEMLRQWEADLRRREEQLRKGQQGGSDRPKDGTGEDGQQPSGS